MSRVYLPAIQFPNVFAPRSTTSRGLVRGFGVFGNQNRELGKISADAKRYKKPEWFRLDAKITDHALWDVLSPTAFKFFVMILR